MEYCSGGFEKAKAGEYQGAIADYTTAIGLKPNYPEAYFGRGDAYFGLYQYDRAISDYNKAVGLKPDYGLAFLGRGNAYDLQGQYLLGRRPIRPGAGSGVSADQGSAS